MAARLAACAILILGSCPQDAAAAPGRPPNVLVILTDDVGFGASSTFGGPIQTPTLDALAAQGLRYSNFHTTALCSPTRAALLTGRNQHAVGMGSITEGASADPGYTSAIPRSAATIARVLREHGYGTAAFGKYHLIPKWELSAAGPFDHWPTSMGFDYFYGFEPAMTDQYAPNLIENTRVIAPRFERDYFFERDLADHAIHWLRDLRAAAPDRPFFMYLATAAAHAPVQAPREWVDRYRGRFDRGWDAEREATLSRQKKLGVVPADTVLTPRAPGVPAWSALDSDERRIAARFMETYAGALSYADHQIGRVIDELRASGQYDDTVIIYIQGDNGASPEGGERGIVNYYGAINALGSPRPFTEDRADVVAHLDRLGGPDTEPAIPTGWTNALDAPFALWKYDTAALGGVRNGMVIAWPRGIRDRGSVRRQFHSIIDVAPTLYQIAGIAAPATVDGVPQQPLDGFSMVYGFDAPAAPSPHRQQYFETQSTLAMYSDGWWASYRARPGEVLGPDMQTSAAWQLFDLRSDFSQARDVAADHPEKLAELRRLFATEAARNHVFPISRARTARGPLPAMEAAGRYVLYPGTERYSDWGFPNIRRRSWTMTARVEVPATGASGVIVNQGGRFAGWGLIFVEGVPNFVYRTGIASDSLLRLRPGERIPAGRHAIQVRFDEHATGGGADVSLSVDGSIVAKGQIDAPVRNGFMYIGAAIGHSTGSALTDDYEGRFAYPGIIEAVEFELAPRR